jgi:HD-like signal output (HDOD) protein
MSEKSKLSTSQWIDILAKKELPAITSIAGMLDKFSNDDVSSIPKLSEAILHDQALSSCLLKVANSSHHAPVRKITTVSRSAIVLGIQAVKNICLTSKILEGLLRSKNLLPEVYERLMMLMANAFYAGLLAKMMVPNHSDDTQEEVYLAAMLYHIGETSFWSTGNDISEQLIKKVQLPTMEFQQYCASETGVRFKDISIGLAKTWNLGDLLVKALDQPESRTLEMQTISLANQLSAAIYTPPKNKADFDNILISVGKIMNIDQRKLKERIEQTRELAIKLLASYGASILESHIKGLPKSADFVEQNTASELLSMSPEKALLTIVQDLTKLTPSGTNVNELLTLALKQMAQVFAFDSCSFWILSADKTNVESRSSYDNHGQAENRRRSFVLNEELNLMSLVLQKKTAVLVNDFRQEKWRDYVNIAFEKLIGKGRICIAPVAINGKTIGVISGQLAAGQTKISEDDFTQFSFIIEHLNMCLSINAMSQKN